MTEINLYYTKIIVPYQNLCPMKKFLLLLFVIVIALPQMASALYETAMYPTELSQAQKIVAALSGMIAALLITIFERWKIRGEPLTWTAMIGAIVFMVWTKGDPRLCLFAWIIFIAAAICIGIAGIFGSFILERFFGKKEPTLQID